MPSPWIWEPDQQRYRNTETGRFIGADGMLKLRDDFIDAQRERVADLASQLASGDIALDEWEAAMRQEIKTTLIDEYVMASGGRSQLDNQDWGRIGAMAKDQYGYLSDFAEGISNGDYTDEDGNLLVEGITNRAQLYMDAGSVSYERARAKAQGAPDLPAYPGDGGTACITRCRCHWEIVEGEDGWECTWVLDDGAEHCDDCLANAEQWAPLFIPYEEEAA